MKYTITEGTRAGAIEIYFESKPTAETLAALKGMRMFWNRTKKCWYGFVAEETARQAINGQQTELTEDTFNKEFNVVATDGYMGATETTGSKSGYLYGAELSKAIRADFKKWGIKGVTVSVSTYSGGQSIHVTITPNENDFLSLDDYKKQYIYDNGEMNYSKALELEIYGDISYYGHDLDNYGERVIERISTGKFFELDDPIIKKEIFLSAIEMQYKHETSGNINEYHYESNKAYTEQFLARFKKIKRIVDAYNHDDSNSMVDYFDRNFYEDYKLKIV